MTAWKVSGASVKPKHSTVNSQHCECRFGYALRLEPDLAVYALQVNTAEDLCILQLVRQVMVSAAMDTDCSLCFCSAFEVNAAAQEAHWVLP